ncbi:MAG: hypothetical protein M3Q07_01630 [Pseudobdellovibrionaceae bacterium]|nr:hypothetical protein [Pseudobdellovibrionaceae bacterium]
MLQKSGSTNRTLGMLIISALCTFALLQPTTGFSDDGIGCLSGPPASICERPTGSWNWDENIYVPWRETDAGTGEWCSHAGSALLIFDINEDGFDDWLCKDKWGYEAVISGLRQFYGYPALRSRTTGIFCRPMDYILGNILKGLVYNAKAGVLGCAHAPGGWSSDPFIQAHTYLKPLF